MSTLWGTPRRGLAPLVTAVIVLAAPPGALACSFGSSTNPVIVEPFQYTTGNYSGEGGYIYSSDTSINDATNDHELYYLNVYYGGVSPDEWVQTGTAVGNIFGYISPTQYIYTENANCYWWGNCANGRASGIQEHTYGPPGTNEGYWTYYDGYYLGPNQTGGGPSEYEFQFDYGSYGSHTPYVGYLATSDYGQDEAVGEVLQGDGAVACEDMDGYFGTNNGTPNTTDELMVKAPGGAQGLSTFSPWDTSVSSGIQSPETAGPGTDVYYWDSLQSNWAAHMHGS